METPEWRLPEASCPGIAGHCADDRLTAGKIAGGQAGVEMYGIEPVTGFLLFLKEVTAEAQRRREMGYHTEARRHGATEEDELRATRSGRALR